MHSAYVKAVLTLAIYRNIIFMGNYEWIIATIKFFSAFISYMMGLQTFAAAMMVDPMFGLEP